MSILFEVASKHLKNARKCRDARKTSLSKPERAKARKRVERREREPFSISALYLAR